MVNLMTAMTNVVEAAGEAENDNPEKIEIQKSQLEEMMKQAQIYYKKRQGVIFNPLTDRGKSRLQVVENLIVKTEKMLKPAPQKQKDNSAGKKI